MDVPSMYVSNMSWSEMVCNNADTGSIDSNFTKMESFYVTYITRGMKEIKFLILQY